MTYIEIIKALGKDMDLIDLIDRQQAEIDGLRADLKRVCAERDARICTSNFIKSEAIKEFANKLKKHSRKMQSSDFSGDFWDEAVLVEDIDDLVKEMIGGKE